MSWVIYCSQSVNLLSMFDRNESMLLLHRLMQSTKLLFSRLLSHAHLLSHLSIYHCIIEDEQADVGEDMGAMSTTSSSGKVLVQCLG